MAECSDRTPRGYLRWRVWVWPFAAGFLTGLTARGEVTGPWSLVMAVSVALALWITYRAPLSDDHASDR